MANCKAYIPNFEASLAPAIAWALREGQNGHIEIEQDLVFSFYVKANTEAETCYTGVTFNGDRETYIKDRITASIKYLGAYDSEGEETDAKLDMRALAKSIEEQDDDFAEFVISFQ